MPVDNGRGFEGLSRGTASSGSPSGQRARRSPASSWNRRTFWRRGERGGKGGGGVGYKRITKACPRGPGLTKEDKPRGHPPRRLPSAHVLGNQARYGRDMWGTIEELEGLGRILAPVLTLLPRLDARSMAERRARGNPACGQKCPESFREHPSSSYLPRTDRSLKLAQSWAVGK